MAAGPHGSRRAQERAPHHDSYAALPIFFSTFTPPPSSSMTLFKSFTSA
jgi:hypothetical protein